MVPLRWLVAAVLLSFTVAQEASRVPWIGCVDPANPDAVENIKIGDPHTICLTLGPGGNWAAGVEYGRYTWRPKADEYSRFYIPDSYKDLVQGDDVLQGNITIHTAAQTQLSFLRVYYDPANFRIYPFLTAVIDVEKGIVQGVAWDDACVFCGKSRCLENMYNFDGKLASELNINSPSKGCYFTEEECNKIHADGGTDCDITLYAVWTGTDIDGNAFQSSGNRFSAFPPGRLQDRLFNQLPDFPSFNDLF